MVERRNKLAYLLILASFVVIIFSVYSFLTRADESSFLDVSFKVEERVVGFNVGTDSLSFGKVPRGGSAYRNITLTNEGSVPEVVKIFVSNNLASYLDAEPEIYLDAGESQEVLFLLSLPPDIEYGEYFGRVKFETHWVD